MRDLRLPLERAGQAPEGGTIAALLDRPDDASALLVLGHGAGAGMRHEFMEDMARRLSTLGVATLRYEFPYMSAGKKRIDPEPLLLASVGAALTAAARLAEGLPIFAGGKSMGGRMTSRHLAVSPDPAVQGLIFFGFPLHPAKKPATSRGDHLAAVTQPMLFLQGTRDDLADLPLIRDVTTGLGVRAELHVVDGADHAFAVLKKSGRTNDAVRDELATATRDFCRRIAEGERGRS